MTDILIYLITFVAYKCIQYIVLQILFAMPTQRRASNQSLVSLGIQRKASGDGLVSMATQRRWSREKQSAMVRVSSKGSGLLCEDLTECGRYMCCMLCLHSPHSSVQGKDAPHEHEPHGPDSPHGARGSDTQHEPSNPDIPRDPCGLDCGHVFCEICLQLYYRVFRNIHYESSGIYVPCPTCRQLTTVPPGGLHGLTASVKVDGERHVSQAIWGDQRGILASDAPLSCEVCIWRDCAGEASWFCGKCRLDLCDACRARHDMQALFHEHTIIHINDKEVVTVYCGYHGNTACDYFCDVCSTPACTICILEHHHSHSTQRMRDALAARREQLQLLVTSLRPKLANMDTRMRHYNQIISVHVRQRNYSTSSSLHRVHSALDNTKYDSLMDGFTMHGHQGTNGIGRSSSVRSMGHPPRKPRPRSSSRKPRPASSPVKQRTGPDQSSGKMDQVSGKMGRWSGSESNLEKLAPSNRRLVENGCASSNKGLLEKGSCDLDPLLSQSIRSFLSVSCDLDQPLPQPIRSFLSASCDLDTLSTQPMRSFLHYADGLHKLCDMGNHILHMSQSRRLLVLYDDLVTRIQTVLDDDLHVLQQEMVSRIERELGTPHGFLRQMAPLSKSSSLSSLDDRDSGDDVPLEEHRVKKLHDAHEAECDTEDTHHSLLYKPRLVWKVEKQRSDLSELYNPCDVSFLQDGCLIVAEYDVVTDKNNRLCIYDPWGAPRGVVAQGEVRPLGVAVTREGNIAVADCKGKRIKLYTPSGQLMADIGKGQFGWPYGITVNSRGQIIVTDAFNDSVSIYQSDGKRIKQFGTSGSGSMQFKNPYHITSDASDNVIVSDCGNNCVKVFDSNGTFRYRAYETYKKSSTYTENRKLRRHRLKGPRGVCTDLKGNILVADDYSRVCMFDTRGHYIRSVLMEEDSVKYPEAVGCCRQTGQLAVTEYNPNNMFSIKVFNMYG